MAGNGKYANGQQMALYDQMLECGREARNVRADTKRGASAARRVKVTRTELAKFEAHCAERAAKNAALRELRLSR